MLSFPSSSSSSSPSASDPQPQQTNPNLEKEPAEQGAPCNNYYTLIPSLPEHVALNCLARVPRCHHRALSLVSKPINSLLSSPLFFHTRSILHATQPFLYLHLYLSHTHSPWFTLSLNPLTTTPLPLPPIPSPTVYASHAVLASDIYVIGGSLHNIRSPHVWILDCRLNRWRRGPTMRAPRRDASVAVINGKIYVMGGCGRGSSTWAEVLDPVVGSWEELVSPFVGGTWVYTCEAVDGKIYAVCDEGGVAYDPRSGVWGRVEKKLWLGRKGKACLVGGVLCSCDSYGRIKGLDVGGVREGRPSEWKEVRGLEGVLPKFCSGAATLTGVGGKLFLVWRCDVNEEGNREEHEIWCCEVGVNKNEDGELWGALCWYGKILSFSEWFVIEQCLAVAL